ncbi:MAG: hypothetical protein LIP23_06290, partial [Planctomycetes bacterium]|nr:hypothetical protein [Planctomycetota bacterium]
AVEEVVEEVVEEAVQDETEHVVAASGEENAENVSDITDPGSVEVESTAQESGLVAEIDETENLAEESDLAEQADSASYTEADAMIDAALERATESEAGATETDLYLSLLADNEDAHPDQQEEQAEQVESTEPESAEYQAEQPEADLVAEEENIEELQGATEPETAEQPLPAEAMAVEEPAIAALQSDEESDYLPGSAVLEQDSEVVASGPEADTQLLLEAQAALQQNLADSIEEADLDASDKTVEPAAESKDTAETAESDATEPVQTGETGTSHRHHLIRQPRHELESRKEARKRERRERRKKKAAAKGLKKQGKTAELPEIVLTRSEETETLIPEDQQVRDEAEKQDDTASADFALTMLTDERFDVVSLTTEKAEPADHTMIIATGGVDLRTDAYRLLEAGNEDTSEESVENIRSDDGEDAENAETTDSGDADANIILFRPNMMASEDFVDEDMVQDESADSENAELFPHLRMLPPVEDEAEETAELEEVAETAESNQLQQVLPPLARLELIRAIAGSPSHDSWALDEGEEMAATGTDDQSADHVITAQIPEPEDPLAKMAEAQAEIEREYQQRLDDFACRLLEVQGSLALGEHQLRKAKDELAEREKAVSDLRAAMNDKEDRIAELGRELSRTIAEAEAKDGELEQFAGIREEHERLYREFEDLRRGYNELVTDVMPALQTERDELIMTVERQCGEEEKLRSTLGATRRKVAVGYAMGAAACLILIGLPVFNWMRADAVSQELALGHQQTSELVQRVEKAEQLNVDGSKAIVNMQYKLEKSMDELERLRTRNTELSQIVEQRTSQMAALRNSGTATRASDMTLNGPMAADGRIRVNEVRDPGRQIDQVVARNREIYNDAEPSRNNGNSRIPVSAVAVNMRQTHDNGAGNLRPPSQREADAVRPGETVASVKNGEGVAQVVYRVLGTRDPEIISWVIRENNLKKDRRGNPRIYPDQKLRLPQNGTLVQTADAGR